MADPLSPVAIQELLSSETGRRWQFEQPIRALETTTPVRGDLQVQVEGPLLRVAGHAETSISLRCDRCLQTFAHRLTADASERIALGTGQADLAEALDFDAEGISEQIDPAGSFDPEQWIYEQLSLQLPLVNRCGSQCPGPASWGSAEPPLDPRWAALNKLR
ncbi:MAG: YceD family protein [Cyanobacteriota bacterium]|nr:YceD family protein [Cyanobacteriota bacterium]